MCDSCRLCTTTPEAELESITPTVMNLESKLEFTRVRYLALCYSSLYSKPCLVSSALGHPGDTIGAGGGCDLSVITRIRSVWGKFRELFPILTSHALSYITRGQIYSTYIRTVLLYASECWSPNVNDLLKLQRNDRAMIRWTCNIMKFYHHDRDSNPGRCSENQTC